MAEVRVTKEPKTKNAGLYPLFGFAGFGPEVPLFRGSLFGANPFALMKHFTEEVDRMFGYKTAITPLNTWRPAIEVKEEKGSLLVTAELPGVKKENVRVHLRGNALVLEGERNYQMEENREGYFHTERSYGRFYRAIRLPELADGARATARFNNGVLEVAIPIPAVTPQRREIWVSEDAPGKAETTH